MATKRITLITKDGSPQTYPSFPKIGHVTSTISQSPKDRTCKSNDHLCSVIDQMLMILKAQVVARTPENQLTHLNYLAQYLGEVLHHFTNHSSKPNNHMKQIIPSPTELYIR
jgi:hypothetical protein